MSLFVLSLVGSVSAQGPSLNLDGGNLDMRVARDADVTFSRERRQAVSLFDVQTRVTNLETWKDTKLETDLAKANVQASLDTVAAAVQATTGTIQPVVDQINKLQAALDQMKNNLPNQISGSIDDLQSSMEKTLEAFQDEADKTHAEIQANMTKAFSTLSSSINVAKSGFDKTSVAATTAIQKSQTDALAKVGGANWCFKVGGNVDDRSSSWKDHPGMKCKFKSTTGWMKITIEGRVYGNNHGGLRVVGGGVTYGKDGHYGFQWMNSEHHGQQWLPFTIVRYVQAKKGATIDYKLQYRSQQNGARFHLNGGDYNAHYGGTWWSMEEMAEPMSKP